MLPITIHTLQSLIALAVIGCSAAKLSEETASGFALAMFTAIATILAATYIITTSLIAKGFFKLSPAVACNSFTMIFWVVSIGALVDNHYSNNCGGYKYQSCYKKRYEIRLDRIWAATLALSVLDGVLSFIGIGVLCFSRGSRIAGKRGFQRMPSV